MAPWLTPGPLPPGSLRVIHVPDTQVKILVPGNHLMIGLLGQQDELLRVVEDAFEGTHIHVRGNEINVQGPDAERVGKLFEELVELLERGHGIDPANLGRSIEMVKEDLRPSQVLSAEVARSSRGRRVHPKTAGQKRYADAIFEPRSHLRHRPGRDRQVLPRGRPCGASPPGEGGDPDNPDAAGGRGG